nr:restriction endonuclease subunit S [Acuticoccus mangrovi]
MEATATPEEIAKFTLRADDVIFTKDSETADDIGISALVADDIGEIVCGYHLSIARPSGPVIGGFVKRVFDSHASKGYFETRASGLTRVGLGQYAVSNLPIPLPPLAEQQAIAAFLDRETGKIDALVEEQRRLIALLKEKRQAVISHAVTKGLDPSAPMKPSGIDWLGDVPAHWEVRRLRHVSPAITVGIVVEPSKYYVEKGVPALRSLNVRPGRISTDNLVYISNDSNDELSKSKLRAGDIVAVRTGQPGTAAVIPPELDGCNCIDLIIIRGGVQISSDYLTWFLSADAALRQFAEGSGGAIQLHFNVGTASNLIIVLPPRAEQDRLLAFIAKEASKIDSLVEEAERAIALLQERRAALISAAVTGKIDVRETAGVEAA